MSNPIVRTLLLEAEILARISAALTNAGQQYPKVDVQSWPDNPANFSASHPLGTVLLIYKGTKYAPNTSANDVAEYEISVMARTLRDPNPLTADDVAGVGMHELLNTIIAAIHGWRPDCSSGQLLVGSEGFQGYTEGVWTYSIRATAPLFPRVAIDPVIGPWTDVHCQNAPKLTRIEYEYTPDPVAEKLTITIPQQSTP